MLTLHSLTQFGLKVCAWAMESERYSKWNYANLCNAICVYTVQDALTCDHLIFKYIYNIYFGISRIGCEKGNLYLHMWVRVITRVWQSNKRNWMTKMIYKQYMCKPSHLLVMTFIFRCTIFRTSHNSSIYSMPLLKSVFAGSGKSYCLCMCTHTATSNVSKSNVVCQKKSSESERETNPFLWFSFHWLLHWFRKQ